MKKNLITLVITLSVCMFLSGCFGTIPSKPVLGESKEGVVLKFDEDGRFVLANDQGVKYTPCGDGQPVQCPPISRTSPRKLIGTISEVKTSQSKSESETILSAMSARSHSRTSSCEYVIEYEVEGRIVYFVASLCADNVNR